MKLKREQIEQLGHRIAERLKASGTVFKVGEPTIEARIVAAIQKNVDEELAIEEVVKKLMDRHRADIASGTVDPQKAYQMIKRQVAKERNFIL